MGLIQMTQFRKYWSKHTNRFIYQNSGQSTIQGEDSTPMTQWSHKFDNMNLNQIQNIFFEQWLWHGS